jgi:hypothetical protein
MYFGLLSALFFFYNKPFIFIREVVGGKRERKEREGERDSIENLKI